MVFEESSDEDVPLSSLATKTKIPRKTRTRKKVNYNDDDDEEAEFDFDQEEAGGKNDDDDDDDEAEEGEIVEDDDNDGEDVDYNEDGGDEGEIAEDDDEDEDEPLSSLKSPSKRKRETKRSSTPTKKSTSKKAKTISTKKKASTKKSATKNKAKSKTPTKASKSSASSTSKSKSNASSDTSTPSAALYNNSQKGKLISEVLKRWWYGMTWPSLSCLPKSVPPNCDKLDGFPGVYVTTSGDEVGKIIDYRNHEDCPNFKNMSRKSSEELKDLLLNCIREQRRVLVDNEGEGTVLEKDLGKLEKWANKVNVDKADRESGKVLKAAGLKIE